MVLMMMTKICSSSLKKNILLFLLFVTGSFCFAEKKWVLGALPFSSQNQQSSMTEALCRKLPEQIFEYLSSASVRVIPDDEEFERKSYAIKRERISLFLQLEAEVKKRDALVLQDLSPKVLSVKIQECEKKIKEIKNKLEKNSQELEKARDDYYSKENIFVKDQELTEGQKYLKLFKNFFVNESKEPEEENVELYSRDGSFFVKVSDDVSAEELVSYSFEKKMVESGVQGLLTGRIKILEDYLSVSVQMIIYPGCKIVAELTEVGTISETELIARNIAERLGPAISSSLPVHLNIKIEPAEARENFTFSVDDIVYKNPQGEIIIDSGVHNIRFESSGYKKVSTSCYFQGNESFEISVDFVKTESKALKINVPLGTNGNLFANGLFAGEINSNKTESEIFIDGERILGVFVSEDGNNGFYSVSEKLIFDGNEIQVLPKIFDKNEFIDKRRKRMYVSYSVFMISVLGSVFTYGNYVTGAQGFKNSGGTSAQLYNDAKAWETPFYISLGVTAASGLWFGYELVRYLMAADSVQPAQGK